MFTRQGTVLQILRHPDLEGSCRSASGFLPADQIRFAASSYESAGPRVVVVPTGNFLNSKGDSVFLDPFTIPFGGNALAVVNLEARIPLTKTIRAVPFYDGGNVFRRVGDIFNPPDVPPNNVFNKISGLCGRIRSDSDSE